MRKLISTAFLFSIISFVTGCKAIKKATTSPINVTGSWVNKEKAAGKTYNSVFIIVLTQNLETRTIIENDLANAATANGIKAVKSLAVFGPVVATADTAVMGA